MSIAWMSIITSMYPLRLTSYSKCTIPKQENRPTIVQILWCSCFALLAEQNLCTISSYPEIEHSIQVQGIQLTQWWLSVKRSARDFEPLVIDLMTASLDKAGSFQDRTERPWQLGFELSLTDRKSVV